MNIQLEIPDAVWDEFKQLHTYTDKQRTAALMSGVCLTVTLANKMQTPENLAKLLDAIYRMRIIQAHDTSTN